MTKPARVAILGIHLESNAFAPPTREPEFRELCWLEGDAILREARKPAPAMPKEVPGFCRAMDASGPWEPVPILLVGATPSGPIDHALFERLLAQMRAALRAAGSIDAVYVCNHGAMTTTEQHDPDGIMLRMIRDIVGSGVKIACTLDLHTNVSETMVEASDVLIVYQTNPHVDQEERGAEAACVLRELLAGMQARSAFIRLPMTPASVALLTGAGAFAELMAFGQGLRDGRIVNVSIAGGFIFSDTPKNGIAVIVTARGDLQAARTVALAIARRAWQERERYVRQLTALDTAVELARKAAAGGAPVILADSGDNPGGGGRGNTTDLLLALHRAGVPGVIFGNFVDPALAAEAHAVGIGERFHAVFNRDGGGLAAARFAADAVVLARHDGELVGRRGIAKGKRLTTGPTALLDLGGVRLVVMSRRYQCADPVYFESLGVDIAAARTVCVKSRGHFRAGFDEFFAHDRIHEIDTGGLTSPVLDRLPLRHVPRPSFPLDPKARWTEPSWR